jgi:L-seryl-tRNA(Ser) seleniumtransferase
LRVDKIVYAALEATLDAYRRGTATAEVPVLRMLSMTKTEIAERAEGLVAALRTRLATGSKSEISDLKFEITDGVSAIGGGAAPNVTLETKLIALSHPNMSASRLEFSLRNARTPIITRIVDDRVMIDLRTVSATDEAELVEMLVART